MTGAISNAVLTIPLVGIVAFAAFSLRPIRRENGNGIVKDDSTAAPGGISPVSRPVPLFASTIDRFAGDWGWPR